VRINNGSASFTAKNIAGDTSYASRQAVIVDIDNDADLDIYVAKQNLGSRLWINDGAANFVSDNISTDLNTSPWQQGVSA